MGLKKISLGLPERLEKSKAQIAVLEKKLHEISVFVDEPLLDDNNFRQIVREILGDDG